VARSFPSFGAHPNEQGQVYTIRDDSQGSIGEGSQFVSPQMLSFVQNVIASFEEETSFPIESDFVMSSRLANELRVHTKQGFWVYLNSDTPLEESYATLRAFLDTGGYRSMLEKFRYIDLRVQDRIYYTRTDQAPEDTVKEEQDKNAANATQSGDQKPEASSGT
jgi:hypothetical protein